MYTLAKNSLFFRQGVRKNTSKLQKTVHLGKELPDFWSRCPDFCSKSAVFMTAWSFLWQKVTELSADSVVAKDTTTENKNDGLSIHIGRAPCNSNLKLNL